MTGSSQNLREIAMEEVLQLARMHRKQLVCGAELLDQLRGDASDADYRHLQRELDRDAPDVSTKAWGHKYLHMLYPDKLDDYHVDSYQRFHLIRLLQVPPEGQGRHWPPALKESGAWPLTGLRQSFLNGALTRLLDPDAVLRAKVVEWVEGGELGLASGLLPGGGYEHVWYGEPMGADEVSFEAGVFLLTKAQAQCEKSRTAAPPAAPVAPVVQPLQPPEGKPIVPPIVEGVTPPVETPTRTLRLVGTVPAEVWNRLGTKVIPKLRAGADLEITVSFTVKVGAEAATTLQTELGQILRDLDLADEVRIEAE